MRGKREIDKATHITERGRGSLCEYVVGRVRVIDRTMMISKRHRDENDIDERMHKRERGVTQRESGQAIKAIGIICFAH